MESEAVSSLKIAVNLIIISALVFTTIVLVSITRGNVMTTVNSIVNVTDGEKLRQFEDYEQKTVSGTKVLRALGQYEDTDLGIVFQTTAARTSGNFAVNIGALFTGAAANPNGYRISSFSGWKTVSNPNDDFYTKGFLKDGSGNVLRFENQAAIRHAPGTPEYIQPDGRFKAELIKDITGETIGICFTQE